MSSRCLQEDVLQLCLEVILKTSWKTKNFLHWIHLQYVFTKTKVCWAVSLFYLYYFVHRIGATLVPNWEQSMLYTKSWQILCRKRIPTSTGLEISSLACKYVFYRLKHKFEDLEMQKWNIPKDWTQRVDEKNGIICLVIFLTPGVMFIKMSKMAHFCIFCWSQQNISHSLGKTFMCTWKILLSSIWKWYVL